VTSAPRSAELAGPLDELEFPPMCANCGNATSESLDVAKVFRHVDNSGQSAPDTYAIARAMVPFCPPCTARHHSEVRQIAPFQRFLLTLRARSMLSALGFGPITLLIVYMALRNASATLLLCGLAALFGVLTWACIRAAYRETEHLAIPPPTSITSAFDFTDDHAKLFEREHRTVTLRNPAFADAFLARNTTHVWNPEDPANRKAAKAGNLLLYVLMAAFLLWLGWFILHALR
jgi:hypothetical protein